MNIYACEDYRAVLRLRLHDEERRSGALTRLAQAARCQKSHLSQVLAGKVHITPDQAFRVAEHWSLDEGAREFFMLLVHQDRATSEYRDHLSKRIDVLRARHLSLSARYPHRDSALSDEGRSHVYYRHWTLEAVHLLTSIPEFHTAGRIAERLSLTVAEVRDALEELAKLDLISKDTQGRVVCLRGGAHLPSDSLLSVLHQVTWRLRALESLRLPPSRKRRAPLEVSRLHYSGLCTVSKADAAVLADLARGFLDATRALVLPSQPEELVCVNLDVFPV